MTDFLKTLREATLIKKRATDSIEPIDPIRFLNIDMDFFLDDFSNGSTGERLSSDLYKPWSSGDVRHFLEQRCLLRADKPIIGRFVTHHDAAFDYWGELMRRFPGRTIDLTHIDAHADMGLGDGSWLHVMGEHLHLPVKDRTSPFRDRGMGLNLGNYIVYAAACRWLSSVIYVHPERGGHDISAVHFEDYDKTKNIQLKAYRPEDLEKAKRYYVATLKEIPPLFVEPVIPFKRVAGSQFVSTRPFDFILVCQSPDFTPKESDGLLSTFTDYINFM